MNLSKLDTPAILIDLDVLDRNLKHTAELAAEAGVKLRPHFKTHKSVWIASKQLEYGATGLTCAKLGEAEVLADAGIKDILVAYPIVGEIKLQRLAALIQRGVNVTVSTDNVEVARGLSDLGQSIGHVIPLYVDVNTGLNRCGPEPGEEAAAVIREMSALPGIEVIGVMTHGGHSYGKKNEEDLKKVAAEEAGGLLKTKEILAGYGIHIREISVGSTPTSKYLSEQKGVTETRPGAYVFGDSGQSAMGIISGEETAMSVLTTVVSTPRNGTLIVDAGSKTFSSDLNSHRPGYGVLKGDPDVYLERLSEEHGIVRVPEGRTFSIGDRLEFIPNHCCVVTNLHNKLQGVRNGEVVQEINVDARGKIN